MYFRENSNGGWKRAYTVTETLRMIPHLGYYYRISRNANISTTTVLMATKLGRVTNLESFLPIMLLDPSVSTLRSVTSLFPQGLWPPNLTRRWFTNIRILRLHYHNACGNQTWQGGYMWWGASFHKATRPFRSRGLTRSCGKLSMLYLHYQNEPLDLLGWLHTMMSFLP